MHLKSLTALVAVVALTACGSSGGDDGASTKQQQITVGVIPIANSAPIYLGQQQGFFSDEGIDLKLIEESGGAAAVPGVVSGNFNFSFGNLVSVITARSQGIPLKTVVSAISSTGKPGHDVSAVLVKKDSPIKSAADLAGRTVAVNNLKNVGDMTVSATVRKNGGDPSKIKFVEMAFPNMLAALAKGRVDAVWEVEPFVTVGQSNDARAVAWNYAEAAPDLLIGVYFTSEKMIKKNPDLVKRFVAAFEKSKAYARANPEEVRKVLLTYTKIDNKIAQKMNMPVWPKTLKENDMQTVADLMLQEGLLTKKFNASQLLP